MYVFTNKLKKQFTTKETIEIIDNHLFFFFVDYDSEDMEFPAEHIILDDFDYALIGLGRKKKRIISNKFTFISPSRDESSK